MPHIHNCTHITARLLSCKSLLSPSTTDPIAAAVPVLPSKLQSSYMDSSSTLKMGTASPFKTVPTYQTTQCDIP
jgi:hypothetical protein